MQLKKSVQTTLLGAALLVGATVPALAQNDTMGQNGNGTGTMMQNGTGGTLRDMVNDRMNGMMGMSSAQDQLFVARAAEGNLAEITLAQLALGKSKTPGVKNVAQTIIQGHGTAQTELMGLMSRKGMTMPPMLSPTHVAVQMALQKAKKAGFDKMYMSNQTDDHENTIALFQTEIMNGMDPDLKAYASKYLPDIVGHTIMIYTVAKQVGAPGSELRPAMPPVPPGVTPTTMPMDGSTMPGMMPQSPNTTPAMGGGGMAPMTGMSPGQTSGASTGGGMGTMPGM